MRYLHEAGWPVYLVLALGLPALGFALRHALAPTRNLLSLIVGLGSASLLMALLGTAFGLDQTINAVRELPPEQRWIFVIGLQESMRNLEIGLVLAVPTAVLAALGAFQLRSRLDAITARSE